MNPESVANLTRQEVQSQIPASLMTTRKILHSALLVSPLIFGAIIMLIKATASAPAEALDPNSAESITDIMLMGIGAMCLCAYGVIMALPGMFFKPGKMMALIKNKPEDSSPADAVATLMAQHMTFSIIRIALFEGTALAGLMVILQAVINGTLAFEPQAYLGALPLAVHLLAGAVTFPSRQSAASFLYDRVIQPLRRHNHSF